MISNPFPVGTQSHRLLEEMILRGKVEVWKIITPRPLGGLGIAQYTARIFEIREALLPLGYEVTNDFGKSFSLRKIEDQRSMICDGL